jgi:hypothetical protein
VPRACKLGLEGIVSKRLGSPYRSGRSRHWGQEQESGGTSGQALGRRRLEQKAMTVGSVYDGADMDDPQELLKIAQHHCQAILTIIDQLTENKSNTELRLLSQRLQRLAFHAAPTKSDLSMKTKTHFAFRGR